jgi:hypothetical protein
MGIQVSSSKGLGPLQREDNHKNGVELFKNLLKNDWARKVQINLRAS